jgi:hypothetical protein
VDDSAKERDAYKGLTPLQREPRREPQTYQELSPQLDFLYHAQQEFAEWVKFADQKSGGVILVLSIGALDVLHKATDFLHAHNGRHEVWGWISLIGFIAAIGAMGLTLVGVARTLFPRVLQSKPSLYFFGVASQHPDGGSYGAAVESKDEAGLREQVAIQAWNLARIANDKYRHLRYAYLGALLFVIAWAVARVTLSLAS